MNEEDEWNKFLFDFEKYAQYSFSYDELREFSEKAHNIGFVKGVIVGRNWKDEEIK